MKISQFDDARFVSGKGEVDIFDREAVAQWVADALDAGVQTAIVAGDDATLSAVVTAYLEDMRGRVEPLTFVPVGVTDSAIVAANVDLQVRSMRKVGGVAKRVHRFKPRMIDSLRVVDATLVRATIGFTFGTGRALVSSIASHSRVRRRDLAAAIGTRGEPCDAVVDWERVDAADTILASSMPRTWANISMLQSGPSARLVPSGAALLTTTTRAGRLTERLRGDRAHQFSRIHIDARTDYVVDGRIVPVETARAVSITRGPRVRILAPS